jgi:DNA gyrase inhibitor YacG
LQSDYATQAHHQAPLPDLQEAGSERCRLIDLGKWASGAYVISSPVDDAEEAIRQDTLDDEDAK